LSATEILKKNNDKALLAIGSKELEPFTHIENYAQRFSVRILPMTDSLEKALALGFHGPNIICMQGPFDEEMNAATLKMTGAKFLVTKDSGEAGGFEAKVSAALSLGCEVIVIARPVREEGYTLDELLEHFNIKEAQKETHEQKAFFPLFVDMNGRKVLVLGGGNVAERRVKILTCFGAEITVISPAATGYIEHAASLGTIRLFKRKYKEGDIAGLMPFLVIAATDERRANSKAMTEARSLDIQVSVADCREECTFYFPAIAHNDAYIAGLVSKNGNHSGVKQTAKKIRELLN
jgi:precorrin-2 dehydrogenase/sirohydrochlorin ferrochelatase/precorrin-6A/cobalt-precorrin-6A reductase